MWLSKYRFMTYQNAVEKMKKDRIKNIDTTVLPQAGTQAVNTLLL
jgi:hypothetical protein